MDVTNRKRDQDYSGAACGCCLFWVLFVLIGILPFVVVTIQDTERGVAYSKIFAKFDEEILESGGIHGKPYAATIFRWPRTEQTAELDMVCNSKDGLLIDLKVSFQFFADQADETLFHLTKSYSGYNRWRYLMIQQAESTIRNVCGDFVADEFQTARGKVATRMEEDVKLEGWNRFLAVVTKLQMKDVQRPIEYEKAVKDKENARSEIALAKNEEIQALIKAQTKIDVANEERIRLLDTANTTAEILLQQAFNERDGILDRFQQLVNVYVKVKLERNLNVKGMLGYISNEVFHKDIFIAVDTPAQTTFKDEL